MTQLLLLAVPDNTTVSYAAFQKSVGAPLANLLDVANPQSLSRKGNHVVLNCAAVVSNSAHGVTVNAQKIIEFDLDVNAPAGLSISKITGVSMKQSLLSGDLKEFTLVPDASGDSTLTGKLQVSRWLPFVTFTRTIGADGTVK